MNATNRWAYHFANEMECVRCGGEENNRRLRHLRDDQTDFSHVGLDVMEEHLPEVDVFCANCLTTPVRGLTKRKAESDARLARKREAYRVAMLRSATQWQSRYDTYIYQGQEYTKDSFVKSLQTGYCRHCGTESRNLRYRSSEGNVDVSGRFREWAQHLTFHQIVEKVHETTPLCPSCFYAEQDGSSQAEIVYESEGEQRASRIKARLLAGQKGKDIAVAEGVSAVYVTRVKKGEKAAHVKPSLTLLLELGSLTG